MNTTFDVFKDNSNVVKAYVFRKMTDVELKDLMSMYSKESNKEEQVIEGWKNKKAPLFSAKNVNGGIVDLSQLKGKPIVLNFWFIACHGCVEEMPDLNKLVEDYQEKGITFIGLTFDKQEPTKAFLQKKEYKYTIIAEAKHIFDQYNIQSCPVNMVIDKLGIVTYAKIGYGIENDKNIRTAIERVLN